MTYENVLRWEKRGLIKCLEKDNDRQRQYSYRDLEKLIRLRDDNPRIAIKKYLDRLQKQRDRRKANNENK